MSGDSPPATGAPPAGHSRWLTLAASAGVFLFALSLVRRGIVISDEGYILSQSLDMLGGKVLYRDMDAFVTPGIWFLHALLFSVVEPSVLASRSLALSGFLGLVCAAYRITLMLSGRAAAWCSVGVILMFSVWAFPAWTFSFYSPFAIVFALWGLERVLVWRAHTHSRDLILAGVLFGLSIAFKQNYGVFASIGAALGVVAIHLEAGRSPLQAVRRSLGSAFALAAGVAAVALPIVAYLALEGALGASFESLILHPFEFASRQDIPYLSISEAWTESPLTRRDRFTYGAQLLYQTGSPFFFWRAGGVPERLHAVMYWIPPLAFPIGLALGLAPLRSGRRLDAGLLTLVCVSGFVFLGVFPRADFNHLVNVYQPLCITGVVVVQRLAHALPAPRPLLLRVVAWAGMVLLALSVYVAGFWYYNLVTHFSTSIVPGRGGVLLTPMQASMWEAQVGNVRKRSKDGDRLLTVPDIAMLNFLADRPMPGRFYNLYEHHIARDQGRSVVEATESSDVKLAVVRFDNFFSDRVGLREYAPDLAHYLRTRFAPKLLVADEKFIVLERREVPREEPGMRGVLDDCREATGKHTIRQHLLFDSLYHSIPRRGRAKRAVTECWVDVPDRAELVLSIGYRLPNFAVPDTIATLRIEADGGGDTVTLLHEQLPIEAIDGWMADAYPEYRIDLSRFANRRIRLLFRSVLTGGVKMGALDKKGFATIWQDPRIELRRAR